MPVGWDLVTVRHLGSDHVGPGFHRISDQYRHLNARRQGRSPSAPLDGFGSHYHMLGIAMSRSTLSVDDGSRRKRQKAQSCKKLLHDTPPLKAVERPVSPLMHLR